MDASRIISSNIKKIRDKYSMSQREFAKELDVTQATYSKYELGKKIPPTEIVIKINTKFGIPFDDIFSNKSDTIDTISKSTFNRFLPIASLGLTAKHFYIANNLLFEDQAIMKEMGLSHEYSQRRPPIISITKHFLDEKEQYSFMVELLCHIYRMIWIDEIPDDAELSFFNQLIDSSPIKINEVDLKKIFSSRNKKILPKSSTVYFRIFSIKKLFIWTLVLAASMDGVFKNEECKYLYEIANSLKFSEKEVDKMIFSLKNFLEIDIYN